MGTLAEAVACYISRSSYAGLERLAESSGCDDVAELMMHCLAQYEIITRVSSQKRFSDASYHFTAMRAGKTIDEIALPIRRGDQWYSKVRVRPIVRSEPINPDSLGIRFDLTEEGAKKLAWIAEVTDSNDKIQVVNNAVILGRAVFEFIIQYKGNPEISFFYAIRKDGSEKRLSVEFREE